MKHSWVYPPALFAAFGVALAMIAGGGYLFFVQHREVQSLKQQLVGTVSNFEARIHFLEDSLSIISSGNEELTAALEAERQKISTFENQFSEVAETVGTLDKLSRTDPELLQKYSKVFFLNEHYEPPELTDINPEYLHNPARPMQFHSRAYPYLEVLLKAARADGMKLAVASAYRSFDIQSSLKSAYRVTYGAGTANQFSADQGYSEHQLGTTVDFNITTRTVLDGFETTDSYKWLLANAHKYGFVLSYPPNNDYYIFEPWHWRYVGVGLATKLHNEGRYFYDLDQREIDEYLVSIF